MCISIVGRKSVAPSAKTVADNRALPLIRPTAKKED